MVTWSLSAFFHQSSCLYSKNVSSLRAKQHEYQLPWIYGKCQVGPLLWEDAFNWLGWLGCELPISKRILFHRSAVLLISMPGCSLKAPLRNLHFNAFLGQLQNVQYSQGISPCTSSTNTCYCPLRASKTIAGWVDCQLGRVYDPFVFSVAPSSFVHTCLCWLKSAGARLCGACAELPETEVRVNVTNPFRWLDSLGGCNRGLVDLWVHESGQLV